ncbi:MAG: glycoside hydrolase family 99-like domain-containing protein, partial [Pseudomonadales bacterium]
MRAIAFYLPQYHPIPENNTWWGPGFTEWTNTAKARPLFPKHYQPHIPADLGFYDLRLPETRLEQAEMAKKYGIDAFCYYHYWFAGRRILERPFNEVLASGAPDFPFCLCWANETWSGVWHGAPKHTLIEQTYPGMSDHTAHFNEIVSAFRDERYVRVAGKPLFLVYRGWEIPNVSDVVKHWKSLAEEAGLAGLHMVAVQSTNFSWNPIESGFDAV